MDRRSKIILNALAKKPCDYWTLISRCPGPLAEFLRSLGDLVERGWVLSQEEEKVFSLTESGKEQASSLAGKTWRDIACPQCRGRGVDPNNLDEFHSRFKEVLDGRPGRIDEYDQALATDQVVIDRVSAIHLCGDLEGQSFLLLGDDDFLGPCLALTGYPKQVTILEIDERIIAWGEKIKEKYHLKNLEYLQYDCTQYPPPELAGRYDCFFVDPTPSYKIIELFLVRAAACLKPETGVGYLDLSHGETSLEKWHHFEKMLLEMNLTITDIIRNFNTYHLQGEWLLESIWRPVTKSPYPLRVPRESWYFSALVRMEAAAPLEIPDVPPVEWSKEIYLDDEMY